MAHAFDSEAAPAILCYAEATGRRIRPVPPEIAERTYRQMHESDREGDRLHLESIRRILDREMPDHRQ